MDPCDERSASSVPPVGWWPGAVLSLAAGLEDLVWTLGIKMTGDKESSGQWANQSLPGKWQLKLCVLLCLCPQKNNGQTFKQRIHTTVMSSSLYLKTDYRRDMAYEQTENKVDRTDKSNKTFLMFCQHWSSQDRDQSLHIPDSEPEFQRWSRHKHHIRTCDTYIHRLSQWTGECKK